MGPERRMKSVIIIFVVVVLHSSFCKHEINLYCPIYLSSNILQIALTVFIGRQRSLSSQLALNLGTSGVLDLLVGPNTLSPSGSFYLTVVNISP